MTHLAIVFPGGYMREDDPHAAPLALIVRRALEEAGAVVEPILYDDLLLPAVLEQGVRRDVERLLATHQPESVTFVAKSLGTRALSIVCRITRSPKDTRMVWLTPVWQWDDAWASAQDARWPALYVVGLDDLEYHRPDRHAALPGETVAIQGADHRLEVPGHILATLDSWRTTADAVLTFARQSKPGSLAPSERVFRRSGRPTPRRPGVRRGASAGTRRRTARRARRPRPRPPMFDSVTIVYGTTVIETKVTNDTEGHEGVSGLALSVDVAATSS